MLDAYIIERIRREREVEQGRGTLVPLHIDAPKPRQPPQERDRRDQQKDEVGTTIVDYQL